MASRTASVFLHGGIGAVLLTLTGCGSGTQMASAPEGRQRIEQLKGMLQMYQQQNAGQMPKDAASFKAWLAKIPASIQQTMQENLKVQKLDEVLISPRDNKPYVINYKAPSLMMIAGKPDKPTDDKTTLTWVAYEADGVGGKRWVVDLYGSAVEMDDAAFRSKYPDAR